MDDNKLDLLLSQQDCIDNDDFTDQVMAELPRPISQKQRDFILIGSLFIGTILSFIILPSETLFVQLFNKSFSGEFPSIAITTALFFCMIFFSFAFVSAANDEL